LSPSRPGCFTPRVRALRFSLDRSLAGPQSRSGHGGQKKKIPSLPLPGIEPRFVYWLSSMPITEIWDTFCLDVPAVTAQRNWEILFSMKILNHSQFLKPSWFEKILCVCPCRINTHRNRIKRDFRYMPSILLQSNCPACAFRCMKGGGEHRYSSMHSQTRH